MKDFQEIDADKLEQMFKKISYWTKIHTGKLLEKIQKDCPSKMIQDGISRITTFYDEHTRYLCTLHRVITKEGVIIHEHIKDAFFNGTWYKCKKKEQA